MKKQITLNQLKTLVMEVRKKPIKDPFEDFEMDDTGVIVKYIGNDEAVVIPDGVRSIGDRAFAGCSSLKSIIIPSGVEVIRPLAFLNCKNLTSVSFPDTLRLIDARAFSGCANLFKIDLPEGVELGTDCFAGTAWQREKNRILSSKLERCEEMDKEETLKWIKKGGLCVYRSGLSFRGAKAHPISTEDALKKFAQYSFENPLYNLSWLIYNDEVALEFCELDENDMFESRKITLTVGQIKRLIKENFYAGQAWKDTWEKMVLRYDREQDCYVPKDDFKDEVEGIVSILNTSPIFGPHYKLTNNPFDSGTNKDNCSLVLDGGTDWKTMKPFLDEFYGTDTYQAYKKGCPLKSIRHVGPDYAITLHIYVDGKISIFNINGKHPPEEMAVKFFVNGQKDIDDMLHLLTRIADKVQEVAKDEDEEEHERRARAAHDQYSIDIERQYGKRYTGAYAKYNKWDENTKMTLTIGQIKRLIKESDEVKLQMVALKRAFDEIKKGKQEAEAGNWKIEALGEWNDELDAPEHGGHWVYFKGAPILEVNYDTMEYCFLMETAILSKEMTDAMLETLECKDFSLEGDGLPDFLSGDDKEEEED